MSFTRSMTVKAARRCRGLSAIALLAGSLGASAELAEIETIIAVVDDDVVLASELYSRLDMVRAQVPEGVPEDQLLSQLLERLILERLQLQEADRRGVQIDDESLTQAVQAFAQQNNMSLPQFRQALAAQGTSYRAFREQIRSEMTITRVQRNLVNRRIRISDQDVDAILNSPWGADLLSDEYRVGHILLTAAEGAPDEVVALMAAQGRQIVSELRAGADFCEMSVKRSASSRALECGDLGWRKGGELPSLFADAVLELKPGETAEPIRSGSSVHIVQLLEQRGAGNSSEQQTDVRHILVSPSEIQTPAETEALINEIYAQLQDGAEFEALAGEYSEDPGSALNGGSLGWSTPGMFVPEFGAAMEQTEIGQMSRPFESQFGWHILRVDGRRTADLSEETRRNMATRLLVNRRFEEELQEWLEELRDEAYVDVRI